MNPKKHKSYRIVPLMLSLVMILSLLVFSPAAVLSPVAQAAPGDLQLNQTAVTLYVGNIGANPVATVNKAFLEAVEGGPVVSWSSSDDTVARVSPSGIVTGMTVGTAVITAESDDDTATCSVTVLAKPALVAATRPAGYSATKPTNFGTTSGSTSFHDASFVYSASDNRYYAISTNIFTRYYSTNLTTWSGISGLTNAVTAQGRAHFNANSGHTTGGWWAPSYLYNPVLGQWCIYYSQSQSITDGGRGFGNKTSAIGLVTLTPGLGLDSGTGWTEKGLVVKSYDALYRGWQPTWTLSTTGAANAAWMLGSNNALSAQYGPNAIDAQAYIDDGRLYMCYGSFYEGIWLIELDITTGLAFTTVDPQDPDKDLKTAPGICLARRGGTYVTAEPLDYRRVMNGSGTAKYTVGIEGSHILHNEQTGYYYLFVSYGYNNQTYNTRVGRSKTITGPYYDYNGYNMITYCDENVNRPDPINPGTIYNTITGGPGSIVGLNNAGSGWTDNNQGFADGGLFLKNETLSWDPNVGTMILAPYMFGTVATPGIDRHVATGHGDAIQTPSGDWVMGHIQKGASQSFGMRHLLWTEDGWPMASPAQYSGEDINQPIDAVQLAAASTSTTANFELMRFDRVIGPDANITATNNLARSVNVTLRANGTVYCSSTNATSVANPGPNAKSTVAAYNNGTWRMYGDNKMEITLPGGEVFKGVVSVGWDWENWDASEFVFAGLSADGTMLWGKGGATGNSVALAAANKDALAAALALFPGTYVSTLYTMWQDVMDVRDYAQAVFDDPTALQQEVDEATQALLDAIATLDPIIPVTGIINVPDSVSVGYDLTLTGTVQPTNATYQDIVWSVVDDDGTGAVLITDDKLSGIIDEGTIVVRATIVDGLGVGIPYTEEFEIAATENLGQNMEVSAPDVLMIKKGAYAYVSIFTDASPTLVAATGYNSSFIDVGPVGGQNTVQCITAKKAGTTVLTFSAGVGGASKTIVVIVN